MCNLGAACMGELARFRRDPAFVICARVILPYKKSSAGSTNELGLAAEGAIRRQSQSSARF